MSDFDFKAEYAKSSRASCKSCKGAILKDNLRLALMVQSPVFDGKIPNWFHFQCFWKRARVTDTSEIGGYEGLRWEDQEKIKKQLGSGGAGGSGGASGGAGGAAVSSSGYYQDYLTEYAKSGGSKCRGCTEKIAKGEVRLGKKDYDSVQAKMYGPVSLWHHIDCFIEKREELEFTTDMQPAKLTGYVHLRKEDKDMLIEKLGKGSAKRKAGESSHAAAKKTKVEPEETEEQKQLKEQSKIIWKYRDLLQKEVSNNAMKALLEYNEQEIPAGESRLLDRVSDCLAFGALVPCKECNGQFVFSGHGYKCTGNATEWTKCQVSVEFPKRKAFKIPVEFHDVDFLKKYKYVKRDRVISKAAIISSASAAVNVDGEVTRPLQGMKFVVTGKLNKSKSDITKTITGYGGEVITKVIKNCAAVIGSKDEVSKMSKMIKSAKEMDVQVVDETFLDDVKNGDVSEHIKKHQISEWGADPNARIGDIVDGIKKSGAKSKKRSAMEKKAEDYYAKSGPSTVKMKLKGGAAVDPDSGMENTCHVLKEGKDLYTVVLGMVDIVKGTNSYYKLQVLESDKGASYYVFRAWGRVGTTIGGNKLERFSGSKIGARDQFKALYAEKTGNEWEDRDDFVKHPNKFYPLDIDFGAEEENIKKLDASAGSRSSLAKPIQELIRMIFDVESMKAAMMEFEIDLKKMPLGKLSKKQIQDAYSVLTELSNLVESKGTPTMILDASNRFYTLIPHDFGMKKPTLLDSQEIIKTKTQMLENLLEIEVAYSMLKGDSGGDEKDPIDAHYEKLNTKMEMVDKSSDEFKRLAQYVKNTHAATHNQYELEVQDIFKVARDGERKRYKPFKALHNRQLLWHGSRLTNFAGILSQGLRIAPPEAPVTGYMFGKGIYFADMVSKSANYCYTSKANPIGLLGLCEVALGNMYERTGAEYVTELPKGKHSTKGLGMTCPDPAKFHTTDDGVVIPMGTPTKAKIPYSSLLYNEYIVYDVAQVQFKYLLKVNFKYKSLW